MGRRKACLHILIRDILMNALTINLKPALELTDEQFFQICQANRDLKFERTATGELIIMPPTGRNGK